MKKVTLLFILGISTVACSVDPNELIIIEHELGELNASSEINVCEPETFTFDQVGKIDVTNDDPNLFVKAVALEGYSLIDFKLHVANEFEDFPIVGQGNLPPGQMEHQRSFSPGKSDDTFTLSLGGLNDCVLIAAKATFQKENDIVEVWAGLEDGNAGDAGNWYYFEYCERECVVTTCNAGSNNTITVPLSRASVYFSQTHPKDATKLIHFFKDRVITEDADYPGSFEPSLLTLINQFNSGNGVDTYSTVYTVTNGECVDSAELTINVYDDSSM